MAVLPPPLQLVGLGDNLLGLFTILCYNYLDYVWPPRAIWWVGIAARSVCFAVPFRRFGGRSGPRC